MSSLSPNRWMRLRQPAGFDEGSVAIVRASAEVFASYVSVSARLWPVLKSRPGEASYEYHFFPVEVSLDRTIISLPIGGEHWSLGTRASFENGSSYMLWQHLPGCVMEGLEEGLTEWIGADLVDNWRVPAPSIGFINADPELRRRYAL